MKEYDLIVIGSGSGLDIASGAAQYDWSVAIIEDGPLGGTCLNRGCIPSKMLIHHADVAKTITTAEKFHIDADLNDVDFAAITAEVSEEVDSDAASIKNGVESNENMDLYRAEARFVDERTVEVDGEELTGENVVIAAGTRPMIPPIDGLEDTDYWTSKEALRATEQPDHLVIIGGGYIATELAHFYGALGTDITIIEMGDSLIGREDPDVAETFTDVFSERYDVHLGYRASEVAQDGDEFTVTAENTDGEEITVNGDAVLVAAGRVPNTDRLEVENAGVETDDRGFVKNNEYLETTADNTWVLGDIAGNYLFKHAANHEAQHVFHDVMTADDHKHPIDYTAMPHAIFSDPQVAGVGKTEDALKEDGTDYAVGVYEYENTGMGAALKEDGFVKLLVDPDGGEILGCHIVGPEASTLIHEVLVAMNAGSGTVFDLRQTIHIHPALNEVVQRAASSVRAEGHHNEH